VGGDTLNSPPPSSDCSRSSTTSSGRCTVSGIGYLSAFFGNVFRRFTVTGPAVLLSHGGTD